MKQLIRLDNESLNINLTIAPASEVTIIDTGYHPQIQLTVGESAQVHYIGVWSGAGTSVKVATLQTNASCDWRTALLGGELKQEIVTEHLGVGSNSTHRGIFLGQQRDHLAMNYWNLHRGQHTAGHIFVHGVLLDQAYADFKGNIKIETIATDTDASLTEETILLGKRARSDSIPQLEIGTNAVRATHSSAITKIDDEQLFYLASRGLPANLAKYMIVRGFLEGVINDFNDPTIREQLFTSIEQRLHSL
ncbi:MAG: SufD family Fe-S cluster assembly protein [Candidatus Kerfeldbacteria bacterium]|nr:SufD family Fe-S cluster assembly protein [Candidatus Kerfeldbacteria bacterium]